MKISIASSTKSKNIEIMHLERWQEHCIIQMASLESKGAIMTCKCSVLLILRGYSNLVITIISIKKTVMGVSC